MFNLKYKLASLLLLVSFAAPAVVNVPHAFAADGPKPHETECKDGNLNNNCSIVKYIRTFVQALSALAGIVIVIMITVGGIQYSASKDNPQATAAAKGRVTNAIIALVSYLLLFGFLQYIVPGGVV